MNSRIRHLQVNHRLPEADPAALAAMRSSIEQVFLDRVLDALERAVHGRLGGDAVLCIRHLSVRWRLQATAIEDAEVAARLGEELADQLVGLSAGPPRPQPLRPRAADEVVLFHDAAHQQAAYLAAAVDAGADAWYFAAVREQGEAWAAIAAAGPARLRAVLDWLVRMEMAGPVLAALPAHERTRLLERLPAPSWPPALRAMVAEAAGGRIPPARAAVAPAPAAPLAPERRLDVGRDRRAEPGATAPHPGRTDGARRTPVDGGADHHLGGTGGRGGLGRRRGRRSGRCGRVAGRWRGLPGRPGARARARRAPLVRRTARGRHPESRLPVARAGGGGG